MKEKIRKIQQIFDIENQNCAIFDLGCQIEPNTKHFRAVFIDKCHAYLPLNSAKLSRLIEVTLTYLFGIHNVSPSNHQNRYIYHQSGHNPNSGSPLDGNDTSKMCRNLHRIHFCNRNICQLTFHKDCHLWHLDICNLQWYFEDVFHILFFLFKKKYLGPVPLWVQTGPKYFGMIQTVFDNAKKWPTEFCF